MNNKIATGIWLVFIGIVILLHNTHVIHFNFYAVITYWPLAIVSVGVSLLLQNRPNGALISTACNILICSFLVFKGVTSNDGIRYSNSSAYVTGGYSENQLVSLDHENGVEKVKLNISGGASGFNLIEPADSSKLFQAWANNSNIKLKLRSSGDEEKKITLDTDIKGNNKNNISFALHPSPIWRMELNLGAASFNADFTPYKVNSLDINSGASSMNLTFGAPQEGQNKIEIHTAASSISLKLPKGTAYHVRSRNIISSNKFEGAEKVKGGEYQTKNFNEARDKYVIILNGAANSFSISTY